MNPFDLTRNIVGNEIQEQLVKRQNDQDDDDTAEAQPEDVVNERMEEAKTLLEKIEEFKRESKRGKKRCCGHCFCEKNFVFFQHDWMMRLQLKYLKRN